MPGVSARPQLLQRAPSPTPFQRWERVRPGGTDIEQKTQKSQKRLKFALVPPPGLLVADPWNCAAS